MQTESLYDVQEVLTEIKAGPENKKPLLTKRETEVLKLLKKGKYYKEIGVELNISIDTVKTHIKNIYTKLGARNKTEALNKLSYYQSGFFH
ncbi:MAG TPA: helix-turn-helix transcriptional regulator [Chitinophagaceae bacterium]|nr:helix-turn-helix transcriptional regulator [Chitinophagaceae bacterium]